MSFDPQKVYSHKSQYLIDIKSSGFENISIYGNSFDNTISANDGDNEIFAVEGNDLIDGFSEIDKSIYTGQRDEYIIFNQL